MILDWCSKLLKSVVGNISVKVTDAAEDADMFESATSSEPAKEETNEAVPVKEPPVEITIKNPKYEFAHGSKFKNGQPRWIVVHYTACAGTSAEVEYTNIQLEKGSKANHYTPYFVKLLKVRMFSAQNVEKSY